MRPDAIAGADGSRTVSTGPRDDPDLSVILVTERYETIARTVRHLRAQTVADRVALVIAAPDATTLGLDPAATEGLHSVQVVECESDPHLPDARAAAIRAARADIVVFGETHSYPDLRWAEALVEAHRGPYAAVGPAVAIANPASGLSRAAMLMDFSRWMMPAAGETDSLPPHNSAFKRHVLLDYGETLPAMLDDELLMMRDMHRRGHRLWIEPAARTHHVNVSRARTWFGDRYWRGRDLGVTRAKDWSAWRRAAYALGAPLIPFARLRHILSAPRIPGSPELRRPLTLLWLGIGLVLISLGEAIGYARGGPRSERDFDNEIYRAEHHVNARDRRLLEAG